jgi:hypothetical protein
VLIVQDLPITVTLVPKTESEPQIVIVTSLVDIMKFKVKPTVHLVTVDVLPVLHMKLVNLVQLKDNKILQVVIVPLICGKMLTTVLVKNVLTNVLNVLTVLTIVILVLLTEFLHQVVSVQMELMMTVLKTLHVLLVKKNVALVLVVMVLV